MVDDTQFWMVKIKLSLPFNCQNELFPKYIDLVDH
jgi:hypothetical protein